MSQYRNSKIPKVSVIIPTRNRAEMLSRAIESVLAQTYRDFELIVVSDGSKDNTEEVVAYFEDPRILFEKHEISRGASAARNTGLRIAKGEYIAFLDDDDEWTLNKLELQVPIIEKSGPELGLVYGWIEYYQGEQLVDKRYPRLKGDIFLEMLDKQAITNISAILVRREALELVQGFDEELYRGNDGDFVRRITKHFEVSYVPEIVAKVYAGHSDRITVDTRKNLKHVIFALEKRLRIFKKDFEKYPLQKSNVLAQISMTHVRIGRFREALRYLLVAMKCQTGLRHKGMLACRIGKAFWNVAMISS